ncbi:MAG: ribosome assembly RNA-binding protein YhbY [Acutalibacteraceae bacterium]|nr:ribosome assembly RNA-binding protein YhbY [Acutalibacteraceae bacterium]
MMLNSRQRAQLRSMANDYETILQIGKSGIGENTVKQVNDALEARELIKIRVLETCPQSSREAADLLAAETNSEVVRVIGSRFILYRESKDNKTIKLVK